LECKIDHFEKEMSKMWSYIQDESKKTSERINTVSKKATSTYFNLGFFWSKMRIASDLVHQI
jgi:hypothetical protein